MSPAPDMRRLVEEALAPVVDDVRGDLSAAVDRLTAEHAARVTDDAVAAADREARIVGAVQTRLDQIDQATVALAEAAEKAAAEATTRQDEALGAVRAVLDKTTVATEVVARVANAMDTVMGEHAARVTADAKAATERIAQLETATSKAAEARAESEAAKVAAEHATTEQATQTEQAETAQQLLVLLGDHEVARATADVTRKATEKATLAAMASERLAEDDHYDAEAVALHRGLSTYYPELRKRLDEITDDQSEDT